MAGAAAPIQINDADLRAWLARLPEAQFDNAKAAFREAVFGAHADIQSNLRGTPMQTRTGALARSILPELTGDDLSKLVGRVYSTSKYAPIHEYGGVVKAKDKYTGVPGGPYLNIPTSNNKTAAGVMRMNARTVFAAGGYIAPTSRGYGVYLNGDLMFILINRVTIPKQLGMGDAAQIRGDKLIERLRAIAGFPV